MRVLGYISIGAVCFAALLGLGLGTSWFGLVTNRPMAKYAEQTRHEVFQQSAAREEGINKSILSECLSMRTASDLRFHDGFDADDRGASASRREGVA